MEFLSFLEKAEGDVPGTFWTFLWKIIKDTPFGKFFGFDEEKDHLGQFWFEAIMFSLVVIIVLTILSFLSMRKRKKIPDGLQNFFEIVYELLEKLVREFLGVGGIKYLPYLGSLFIYIFCMNILGIFPAFRSPTATLSTTLALGLTTFFVVQISAIRENGISGYLKHFTGGILWLAPLMFIVHIIGEVAKPVSLSLRLYGNIFGEDAVVENLIHMGGIIPLQFPMLFFVIFTSLLQAFIFTALTAIYISFMTSPEEEGAKKKEET